MNKKNILVVSNPGENNSLHDWLGDVHPFHVNTADNDEAAIELFHQQRFDMVIVDGTDHNIDDRKLHTVLPTLQKDVLVLRYQGETVQDLDDHITAVFDARKYDRMQRILMIDPTDDFGNLPPFSLN